MNYNLEFTIDEELKEIPHDPEDVLLYLAEVKKKLPKVTNPKKRVEALSDLGFYLRITGELEEAEKFLAKALEIISEHELGRDLWIETGLKLAKVYQWIGAFDVASDIYDDIIEMCNERPEVYDYLHFAIHQLGEFHFDLHEIPESLECFRTALEVREYLGEEQLAKETQFGLDMALRLLNETDNVIQFPSSKNKGDDLKGPQGILNMVKSKVEDRDDLSIEGLQNEVNQVVFNQNNLPKSPFLGLSPSQMHGILYAPFTLNNEIFSFKTSSEEGLKEIPLVKQALFLLEKIQEKKELKTTQKGNFPRALVLDLYFEFFSKKKYAHKPSKEDNLPEATRLKHVLDMAGLIKKRNSKFSLTKKAEKILEQNDLAQLFELMIDPLFNKWNWGYSDRLSELMLVQSSAIFNLYLLHKMAQNWIHSDELGKAYLEAFPALVNEASGFFEPDREVINCFEIRFLSRMCLPLGLVEAQEVETESILSENLYKVSKFFKDSLVFH